jgi:hypothetical protein
MAFLKNEKAEMARQVAFAAGRPGQEDVLADGQDDEDQQSRPENREKFTF